MKIFADVHSETSPRSLSRITSSKPRHCADSSQVRFIAHERIFVPAKGHAAYRAFGWYASFTPSPQSFDSAVSAIRSLSRPLDGPAHMPPPLRTTTRRNVQLGARLASTNSTSFRRTVFGILRQWNVHRGRVALHTRPMALEGEKNAFSDAQRAEDAPPRKQAHLAGRRLNSDAS